jgi:hypothetical protein
MNTIIRGSATALAVLAAGCGGGGGSDNVALKSGADVAREMQNLSTLYVDGAPAPRSAGVRGLLARSAAGQSRAARAQSLAKVSGACGSGTYTYEDVFAQARSLPLFGASPVLDYTVGIDYDCRYTDGTFSEFYDGNYEYGDNGAYTAGTAEVPYYDYYADGTGSTPYRVVLEDTDFDETLTIRTLGRYEGRDTGTSFQSREVFALDFTYAFSGDSIRLDVEAGDSGDPLIFVDNYDGDGTLSIDGPFSYSSDICDGGNLRYDTVQNLTLGFDETYGYFPNGGQLRIESGGAGVTLDFQADGDILYTFDSGASGTVTLDQVAAAEACVFMP